MNDTVVKMCRIDAAVGKPAPCPGDRCPYWEHEPQEGCALERLAAPVDDPGIGSYLRDRRILVVLERAAAAAS
jgi:hypothetical protein